MFTNLIDWQGVIGEDCLHNTYKFIWNDNLNQEKMTNKNNTL